MLLSIFLVVFIDLIGFGIVIPILPYYAREFGASATTLGWLMAVYSLMQFAVAPLWGKLSDRIGRRPVLLLSLIGTLLSQVMLGLASHFEGTLTWIFAGRIFAGVCAANLSVAYAYVADVTTPENRARGMGMIGAGFGLGFIVGPALGALLSPWGYDRPMFAAAALTAFNLVLAWFKLREPEMTEAQREASRAARSWGPKLAKELLARSAVRRPVQIFFLVTLAVTQMEAIFAIFMADRFGYSAEDAGFLLAGMGLAMAIVQGGLVGRVSRLIPEIRLVSTGTLLSGVALVIFGAAGSPSMVMTALLLLAFSHGFVSPSLSSLASRGAPEALRGSTMGVFHSAGSLARVLGPPAAGWLFDHWGASSPFFLGSLFLGAASLLGTLRAEAPDA